jgi:hypothetical protein
MASLENEQDPIGRDQASAERSVSILWHPFYYSLLPGVGGFLTSISLCAAFRVYSRAFERWILPLQYPDYEAKIKEANDLLENDVLHGTPWIIVLIGLAVGGVLFEVDRRLIRHHHSFIVTRLIMTKDEKKKLGIRRHLQDLRYQWPELLIVAIALIFTLYAGPILSLVLLGAMASGYVLIYNPRRDIYLAAKCQVEPGNNLDALPDLDLLRFTHKQKIRASLLTAVWLIIVMALVVLMAWIAVLAEDLGVILLEDLRAEASSNVGPPN